MVGNWINYYADINLSRVYQIKIYVPCRNGNELLRVGLHWRVPFIEVLSETVQVVWQLVVTIVKSTLRASLLKGDPGNADGGLPGSGLVLLVTPSGRGLMDAHAY